MLTSSSAGEGCLLLVTLSYFPYPPYPPIPVSFPSPPDYAAPSPGPSDMLGPLWCCRGLATMRAAPRW